MPRTTAAPCRPKPTGRWCALVRRGASIGSNATIVAGVTIGRGAMVGAGAVVTRDIPDGALALGVPAARWSDKWRTGRNSIVRNGGDRHMIGVGIIGYGYWGPNLARSVAETDGAQLTAIADFSAAALARAGKRYPAARLVRSWRDLLDAPDIDAVIIATPVSSHFEIALAALRKGKHVLVEKPITDRSSEAC